MTKMKKPRNYYYRLRNENIMAKKGISSKDLIINILQENIGSKESMVRDNTMLSHKNDKLT